MYGFLVATGSLNTTKAWLSSLAGQERREIDNNVGILAQAAFSNVISDICFMCKCTLYPLT